MVYLSFGVFLVGTCPVSNFEHRNIPAVADYRRKPAWLYALYDTFFFHVRKHKPLLWVFPYYLHVVSVLSRHLELLARSDHPAVHEFLGAVTSALQLIACLFLFRASVRRCATFVPGTTILILSFELICSQMDGPAAVRLQHMRSTLRLTSPACSISNPSCRGAERHGHSFMLVIHVFLAICS